MVNFNSFLFWFAEINMKYMKTMLRSLPAVITILLAMGQAGLLADTIVLRNGQILSATVIDQKQNEVTIKLPDGERIIYQKNEIIKISYKSVKEVREEISQEVKEVQAVYEPKEKNVAFSELVIEKETSEISRSHTFLYSALLPGLGQFRQKRQKSACFWFGSLAVMTVATIHYRNDYTSKREIYDQSVRDSFLYPYAVTVNSPVTSQESGWLLAAYQNKLLSTQKNMRRASVNADSATGLLLAFYLSNLTDVIVFHPARNQTISLGMNEPAYNEIKGVQFAWKYHF